MRQLRNLFFIGGTFAAVACVAIALIMNAVLFGSRTAAAQPLQPRIVYGLTFIPSGFDPHINQNSELGIVFRSVYDTLLYRDPVTKAFKPGLADRVEISSDGLVYTFHLKVGVKFHDGEPFNAAAVAATLDRIVNPETKSQKSLVLLGPYSRYQIVDDQTIQVRLNTPYAPLLDAFAQVYLGIASPKALREYDNTRYQFHQVGTGPFKLVDYIPGERVILQRNPDYTWGPDFYKPAGSNALQEIEFRFFQDPSTRAPALETGAAQIVGELAPADALIFSRGGAVRIIPQPIAGQPSQFFINTTVFPTDDLNVRKALLLAADRQSIVDSVFQQFSPVAFGPLSAVTQYYEPKVQALYKRDLQQARDLLGQAGYTDSDNNGYLDKPVTDASGNVVARPLKIVLVTLPTGLQPQIAAKLQNQWKEIGVEVEIRQVPNFPGILGEYTRNDYNLIAFNDSGLDATLLNRFYRSDGSLNFSKFVSTDLDAYLDRAMASTDDSERATLYGQAQLLIMDNALVLPIRDVVNLNGASVTVENLQYDPYGWFPLLANVTIKPTP